MCKCQNERLREVTLDSMGFGVHSSFCFLSLVITTYNYQIFKLDCLLLLNYFSSLLCVFVSLRMLLEKSSGDRLFVSVTVSEQAVIMRYRQPSSRTPLIISFRTEGRLTLERWTHLVLQVTDFNPDVGTRDHCPVKHAIVGHYERPMIMSMYVYVHS